MTFVHRQQTLDIAGLRTHVKSAINRDTLPLVKENHTTVCFVVKQQHCESTHIIGTQNKETQTYRGKEIIQSRAAHIGRYLYREFAVFQN